MTSQLTTRVERREVSFKSQGVPCAATLFLPAERAAGETVAALAMAGAVGFTKEMFLPAFAEVFAAAGCAALIFDFRHLGAAGGEPRGQIFPAEQEEDLRNAISFLVQQPEVDANRIGVWGVSLGGGLVLPVAAYDRRVKAAVSMAPSISAYDTMAQAVGREGVLGFLGFLTQDRMQRYATGAGSTLPIATNDGTPALGPDPRIYDFYTQAAREMAPTWRNEVTIASIEKLLEYRPAAHVHLIAPTPLLMIVAEQDEFLPANLALAAFEQAQQPKQLELLPCGHADVYREPWFTRTAELAVAWFRQHLGSSPAVPARPDPGTAAEETKAVGLQLGGVPGPLATDARPANSGFAKAIFRHLTDEVNASRLEVLDELVVDDYLDHDTLPGQEPGRAGLKKIYAFFRDTFSDLVFDYQNLIADDGLVLGQGILHATHSGDFYGIAPTGKRIHFAVARTFRIRDGQIVEGWFNLDMVALMQQLGAAPASPGTQFPPSYPVPPTVTGGRRTSPEENKALMRRFIQEVWNQGHLEVADELFHPEASSPSAPELPRGSEGVKAIARTFRSAFPDYWMTIDCLLAEGDRVAARFTQGGTHHGELFGIPATGKAVRFTETGVLRVDGGRVVESWYVADVAGLMQQLVAGGSSASMIPGS